MLIVRPYSSEDVKVSFIVLYWYVLICSRALPCLVFFSSYLFFCYWGGGSLVQIWMPLQVQVSTLCTVLKLFTWFVANSGPSFLFPSFYLILVVECIWVFLTKWWYIQVRHAQGIHNVEGEKDHSAYMSYDLFDAHLTPLGWNQVITNENVQLNLCLVWENKNMFFFFFFGTFYTFVWYMSSTRF